MSDPGEIRFSQASREQIALAADLSYRIYGDTAIKRAFASPEAVLRRWEWILDGNPVPSPFGLPAWVAARGEEVVGHFALIPATARVAGRVVDVAWGRDFFVDASVRGIGVGSKLVETALRTAGIVLVAGLNPPARRAYGKVGFIERGQIPFFVRILRPADVAARISPRRVPSWAARVASEAAGLWGRRGSAGSSHVRVADAFDDRFDEWWPTVERGRSCVMRRTSATMNWRYGEHPSHKHTILELERAGRLRGIAVVRDGVSRRLPAGVLVELLVEPGDRQAADELVSAVQDHFRESSPGPAFLRSHTFGREAAVALIRAGFIPAPSPFRWMIANGQRLGRAGAACRFFLNGATRTWTSSETHGTIGWMTWPRE